MAVPRHRLILFLVVVLKFGLVFTRALLSADEHCKEDLHQRPDSLLTCINMITIEDVLNLHHLLNQTSQAVVRFQYSEIGLLPDDIFVNRSIKSLFVISSGLREIPIRLVSPICGYSLRSLYISKNNIAAIQDGGFYGCSKVHTLDLSSNGIRTISRRAFQGLDNLIELNLQYNDIRAFLGFESLGALKTLFLTKNGIAVINSEALNGMNELVTLDLSYNQLTTIDEGTLEPMTIKDYSTYSPRRFVYLEGNPWNCTCSLKWLQNWLLDNGFPKNDPECAAPEHRPLMTFDLCQKAHSNAKGGHKIGILLHVLLILYLAYF